MGSLYNLFLVLHSWNRWIILLAGIALIIASIIGLSNKDKFSPAHGFLRLTYLSSLHIQLLIGILLYFVFSPLTQAAFNDIGNAMKTSGLRFWLVEHTLLNVIGIVLAQIGYSKSKKKLSDKAKFKTLLIYTSISLFIILLAVPMGIMGVERPWFRF